jgi:hypothetical protein
VLSVRRDRIVAKTIEPTQGGDPNITFAIFEERGNNITGESISLRKYLGVSLMEMNNTGSRRSNPNAAIAVPEKYYPIDVTCRSGIRMLCFQLPAPESSDPSGQRNQKGSIASLAQVLYRERPKWHVIEPGRAGPPSPNTVTPHHPEHVVAIFIQASYSVTEGDVRSIAVNICSIDRAELSRRSHRVAAPDPNRSVATLNDRSDN